MAKDEDRRFEDVDLSAIVADGIASSRAYAQSELDGKRSLALEYIQGRMRDITTLPNRSRLVSRDVADTLGWVHPGIMRVFTSSSTVVEYEAVRPGTSQWAKDATEFMNYDFMCNNDGYRIFYNATWDALALDMGLCSSEWVPVVKKRETVRRQTLEQLALLEMEDDVEILTAKELEETYEMEALDEFGIPTIVLQPLYDVKINRTIKEGHIRDETLRPENLLINEMATTIDEATFVGYRYDNKTRSDLMEMADSYGFDKATIRDLPSDGFNDDDPVQLSRDLEGFTDYNSPTRSGDIIDLYRCFPMVDVDGDGIAECVEVWYAGNKVLAWQVWEDEIPYTDIPCYPAPHRFNGESVADRTMDIQRAKTVLLRQAMDNLYATNVPTQEVEVGSVLNPDALVQKRFGAILWKKQGSAPVVWGTVPYVADKVFAAMPYFDEMRAMRTGVSRTTMALDPEALQNQTATAAQQQRDAGYSQTELVARNMAELGFVRFFKKRLKLAVKYQQVASVPAPEEEGEFREVYPQQWDDDMAATVNTGLGTGSKDRDMAMLNAMMNVQTGMAQQLAAVPGAQAKAIEFIPKILDTAIKLAESSGLKNPETYFPVVTPQDVEQWKQSAQQASQQPSPEVQKEQAKIQAQAQKDQMQAQLDAQKAQQDAQLQQQKFQQEAVLQREKFAQDAMLERERIVAESETRLYQINQELALKERQLVSEIALKERIAQMTNQGGDGKASSEVSIGGDPG